MHSRPGTHADDHTSTGTSTSSNAPGAGDAHGHSTAASVALEDTTASLLLAELVEHVMRLTDDEFAVLAFMSSTYASNDALAALGRLGPHAGVCVGSPLYAWCTGTRCAPAWRGSVPASPSSLWAELEDLRAVLGPHPAAHAYDELCQLRDASAEWLG